MANPYPDYRSHVGPPELYDIMGACQFAALASCGLREGHKLLDIGCGSLRLGRFLIPYLLPGNYYGLEPAKGILAEGRANNLTREMIRRQEPVFKFNANFDLQSFGTSFDFIVAQSVFSHATKDHIARCMRQVERVLKAQGLFVFTWAEGTVDYDGEQPELPLTKYRRTTIERMARHAGLAPQGKYFHNLPHRQKWMFCAKEPHVLKQYSHIADF